MLEMATSMNTYEFLFVTYAVSVLASLVFVVARGKTKQLARYLTNRKDLAIIAAMGLLNYAFLEFGLSYAERFVSVSLATVVYRTYPILMLLFLPLVLRERITKYQFAALSLAFVGLYLAVSGGGVQALSFANSGIMLILIAIALSGAFATLLVKKYMYDMESCIFIFSLANFAFFALLFVSQGMPTSGSLLGNALPILYVGIVYNVLVGFMYYAALRMFKTTFVTNVYFLSPFITFVFSSVMLGETIKAYYVLIAVLVAVGIWIQKLDKVGGSYASRGKLKERNFTLFDVTGPFANSGEAGISTAIRGGGRVLALKLEGKHRDTVENFVESGGYENVFTDRHESILNESNFVKEVIGAGTSDVVVMKAGDADEGERFFIDLSDSLGGIEDKPRLYLPDEQK
jgi:drug/metabolite transporter (DMT)-like permease